MAYELKLVAATKEEAEEAGRKACKEIDFVCQPHIIDIREREDGQWLCIVKYWGYD